MPAIHLIERMGHIRRIDKARNEWASGYWALSRETAARLEGGGIYFHECQSGASFFGGEIVSYFVQREDSHAGKIVYLLRADLAFKGVTTGREGWRNEMKIVWDV